MNALLLSLTLAAGTMYFDGPGKVFQSKSEKSRSVPGDAQAAVEVESCDGGWCKVRYRGRPGFVREASLRLTSRDTVALPLADVGDDATLLPAETLARSLSKEEVRARARTRGLK